MTNYERDMQVASGNRYGDPYPYDDAELAWLAQRDEHLGLAEKAEEEAQAALALVVTACQEAAEEYGKARSKRWERAAAALADTAEAMGKLIAMSPVPTAEDLQYIESAPSCMQHVINSRKP